MRILVLSDKVLSRQLGDGLRVHGLLAPLAHKHEFDLICYARDGEGLEPELSAIFRDVRLVPAPPRQRASLLRRAFRSMTAEDFKLTSAPMQQAVSDAMRTCQYDLILEEAANTIPNLPVGPLDAPLIVDSIDEPLLRELRALRHARWRQRPEHLYRALRFWSYERRMLGRAAINVYVSEVDANLYTRFFPDRRVAVVPNGVDTEYFRPFHSPIDPVFVVFEGNMNFGPNVDTAEILVREILPRLRQHVPQARIGLVGRNPTPDVLSLASEHVEVTGEVEDVRPFLARAAVFACPMRLGSGIKNKILQAWAMGRPVVATSQSLGGLAARDGFNILVRDEWDEFASAIAGLIADPARAAQLGQEGRHCVDAGYSWNERSAQLDALFNQVAGSTARGARPGLDCGGAVMEDLSRSAKEAG